MRLPCLPGARLGGGADALHGISLAVPHISLACLPFFVLLARESIREAPYFLLAFLPVLAVALGPFV